jgi:hypothetical protein
MAGGVWVFSGAGVDAGLGWAAVAMGAGSVGVAQAEGRIMKRAKTRKVFFIPCMQPFDKT